MNGTQKSGKNNTETLTSDKAAASGNSKPIAVQSTREAEIIGRMVGSERKTKQWDRARRVKRDSLTSGQIGEQWTRSKGREFQYGRELNTQAETNKVGGPKDKEEKRLSIDRIQSPDLGLNSSLEIGRKRKKRGSLGQSVCFCESQGSFLQALIPSK